MKRNIARQQKKKILAALCLVSLMLTAPEARSEKVVVIPLGSKTVIEASIYWAGEWGENLLYKPGDGIQHEGNSYLCRKNHTSSQASMPPDTEHWELMAAKGDQGDTGAVGPAGPKGDQGDTGAVGPAGPKGDQGDTGAVGPAGPKGDQGDTGAVGPAGPKGDQGDTGAVGPAGPKGDQGDTGTPGVKGDKGDQGIAGPQGLKGDTGDPGSPGPKGDTGEAGIAGPQGVKGDTGDPGAPGLKGDTGAVGPAGPKGDQGDKGDQGIAGPQGIKGDTGDTGAVGPAGPKGDQGDPGSHAANRLCPEGDTMVGVWEGQVICGSDGFVPPSTVTSATGRVWMDRNLGASRVAGSIDDAEAYGDLYQWGRGTDGHEKRAHHDPVPQITGTLSSTDDPGHDRFITTTSSPTDWRDGQNDDLWQGVDGTNNPCPSGFRLPTSGEWQEEQASWSSLDAAGAFASPLKLPAPGYRRTDDGQLYSVGWYGYYWTSTTWYSATYLAQYHTGADSAIPYGTAMRALGSSVRCIKD